MKKWIAPALIAAAAMVGLSGEAKAEGGGVLGILSCSKTGTGTTYVLHSRNPVECTYDGIGGPQKYTGIDGILLGIDLEIENKAVMGYLVLGGTWKDKNSLEGYFVGAKASATLGVGIAAQAGLAGIGNDITLVPIGLGGQIGIGATGGISYLAINGAK
ncbi:hypothetical protein A6A04_06475 [Paramagnetospirillum marisnigri]|uniref:DUF992 domain-containing protein n=1 Tax=Paramagnetospirillum marisnigri TaxID=1285242 RepID=A0A178MF69_9PROT|nr:DUF992 domain-containing protein [Paramagnetospirillum marisnigri]OAN46738.1 hypothetical protein A6A04_06475 [Paramagnetospirillum marisnigri]